MAVFSITLLLSGGEVMANADSLQRLISRSKSDTARIRLMNQLANTLISHDITQAKKLAEEAANLSIRLNYARGLSRSYETMGNISYFGNSYSNAIKLWKKSLLTSYLPSEYSRINQQIGNAYMQITRYDSALWHFIRAEKMLPQNTHPIERSYNLEYQSVALIKLNLKDSAVKVLENGIKILDDGIKNLPAGKTEYNKMLVQLASLQGQAANALFNGGKYTQATAYMHKAIAVLVILGDRDLLPLIYDDLGDIYQAIGNYDKAIENYYKALKIKEEKNDRLGVAGSYNNIAAIYFAQNSFPKAEELFRAAYIIHKEAGNKAGIAQLLNNLGEVQRSLKQYDSALKLYDAAIRINELMNNQLWTAINYQNKGETFMLKGDYDNALQNFNIALKFYRLTDNKNYLTNLNNSLGNYYLKKNDRILAKKYFTEALNDARNYHYPAEMKNAALGLSVISESEGDYRGALMLFKLYNAQSDTLLGVEMNRQMAEIQTRYELEKKENEITIQKEQINLLEKNEKINAIVLQAGLAALVFLVIIAYLLYSRQKSRSHAQINLADKNQEILKTRQALMEADLKNRDQEKLILNQELQQKNNHLINMALSLAHKNEFFGELKKGLKEIKSLHDDDKEKRLNDLLLKIGQQTRITKELERLQAEIEEANATFFKKLNQICPEMTENERQLSALLRINLSSKEIASLNNITTKAVEMSRYRLRKKLNIEGNNTLTDFLQDL
ncbi:MAG: hypothetical protein A2X11_15375 [Bacteroidetes bacterium GWE2_42_24]|nr:MAG: hypothetical protein A2X11_15375 [Bacteroidetes bacterium GWE2_42_24]OFY31722.1 MAG: hypothetical protein A2X09_09120 [Bacteroidetes bacterium GWF2_43_11]